MGDTPKHHNTDGAARYLREKHGLSIQGSTIARKRYEGGGPAFFRAGRQPRYTEPSLDEWAASIFSALITNTASERV